MTEAEQVMKRCQIGTRNYDEANNLHADCYRVIGKLLAEHAMREVQRLGQEIEQAPVAKYSDIVSDGGLDPRNTTPPQRTEQCNYPDCKCPTENPCLKGLVQPEQEPKIGCVNHDCDQCKAQPEQEPVAFASHGVINWIADKQFQHEADLYTTPPQQTWVGLNDDEIDYLIHLAYTGDEEFVQTIEAKLKEKNLPCIKPKWIGLTEKEHTDIAVECGCMSADWVFYGAAVERKLKERNT